MAERKLGLAMAVVPIAAAALVAGILIGYQYGIDAAEDAAFLAGYCAGLDIADTSCESLP
jgi:hypothetical protein